MSAWNAFVKAHYHDPEIMRLPARERFAALSALRDRLAGGPVASPKYAEASTERQRKARAQRAYSGKTSLAGLFSPGGSFCKGKERGDCSRIPGCKWYTPRGKTAYCGLPNAVSRRGGMPAGIAALEAKIARGY